MAFLASEVRKMALIVLENSIESEQKKLAEALKCGKIAIYPTGTCYGIGCGLTHEDAVWRIFEIKSRKKSQPLSVVAASKEMIAEFAVLDEKTERLIDSFMPGPLTLLLERSDKVPSWFPGEKIGIRVPENKTARKLSELVGEPIISTSANYSGKEPIYSSEKAITEFGKSVDIIVDAGSLEINAPTTVFDPSQNKILRKGKISLEEIQRMSE